MGRIALGWCLLVLVIASQTALAQSGPDAPEEPSPTPPEPDAEPPVAPAEDPRAAEARRLFETGVRMFQAGELELALEYFTRSRSRFPTPDNTINAAICLGRLKRHDESLELYDAVIERWGDALDGSDRSAVTAAIVTLRKKVGSLSITANVSGSIVIDGRLRGELPAPGLIRVRGGAHQVRILKDGYRTFERRITIGAGEEARIDARLEPLGAAGGLRVEAMGAAGADVYIDRAHVGVVPWEGTLGPGEHAVWIARDDIGTAPTKVVVVQGQTTLLRLRPRPLGPTVRIHAVPATANLWLGAAALGAGAWSGRLPKGRHRARAHEPGYHARTMWVRVDGDKPLDTRLTLPIDPEHPRWPKPLSGTITLAAFGGFAFGRTLAPDAEKSFCDTCPGAPGVLGLALGLRGGYRFPIGLTLDARGGYLRLASEVPREVAVSVGQPNPGARYRLTDDILLSGAFIGAGVGYQHAFGETWGLSATMAAGMHFLEARDVVTGEAVAPNQPPARVGPEEGVTSATAIGAWLMPELQVQVRFGSFHAALGLGAMAFVTPGPESDSRHLQVNAEGCSGDPQAPACLKTGDELRMGRVHGVFIVAMPELLFGYSF